MRTLSAPTWRLLGAPLLIAGVLSMALFATQTCSSDNGDNCDNVNCNQSCNHNQQRCLGDDVEVCDGSSCCGIWRVTERCSDQGLTCASASCVSPETLCDNNQADHQETDVDCGGTICPACPNGSYCGEGRDCESGFCSPQYTCDATP